MRMKREFLKELGLEKEVIDQIMEENGKDIESSKAEAAAEKTRADGLQGQLADANKEIESYKDMDVEGIKKSAEDYKKKFEESEAKSKKDMADLKFSHALDAGLSKAKAKNSKSVKPLLDLEALKLQEDGTILGLNEQLEKIKGENDFLFESDDKTPTVVKGTGGGGTKTDEVAVRAVMGLPPEKE
jgi:homoserine dehydrogenase